MPNPDPQDVRSLRAAVDHLIDTRPGKELLTPVYDDPAYPIVDGFIYRSGGNTASYMIVTETQRVIINTGMFYEVLHHKRVFDAVSTNPTKYIITTQAHVDHVGGVYLFREPATQYVAQENNPACQRDDARIQKLRIQTAGIWFDVSGKEIGRFIKENPGVRMQQDTPVPDVMFSDRLRLTVDDLQLELISTPGGETIDSVAVWLPQHRTALVSNLFGPLFPHFPNFNTLRGDKYRFAEPYLASVRTVRELKPELLIVGRNEPIRGAELIDACLRRLHDAVEYVHTEVLRRMNEGDAIDRIVSELALPPELRVGQGYGKVAWAARTMWESYIGWFRLQSSTEMYSVDVRETLAALVQHTGVQNTLAAAKAALSNAQPVQALHLAEAVLASDPNDVAAAAIAVAAHDALLADGGDESFWESGFLKYQRERFAMIAASTP